MKFRSSPAWSLRPRHPIKGVADQPGPGAYEPKPALTSPSYRIGTGSRSDFTRSGAAPGPGAYDPKVRPGSAGPQYSLRSFGTDKRKPLTDPTGVPGPGSYQVPVRSVEGPQYSIASKPQPTDRNFSPGPGAYDHDGFDNVLQRAPQSRIGSAKRDDLHTQSMKELPGPGQYEADEKFRGPKWGFGTQPRGKEAASTTPAPGSYNFQSTLDPRGYSIKGKHPDNTMREAASVPGPGTYNPSLTDRAPSYRVGTGGRSDFAHGNEVPGPGSYNPSQRPKSAAPV